MNAHRQIACITDARRARGDILAHYLARVLPTMRVD